MICSASRALSAAILPRPSGCSPIASALAWRSQHLSFWLLISGDPMQMTDRITERGLLALIRHEGIVPGPYMDANGVWTFGIGHTAAAGPPDPERMPRGVATDPDAGIREAFRILRADINHYETGVSRAVKVALERHEFDALVSFHYNTGGIARAALTRHLNAGRPGRCGASLSELAPARRDHPAPEGRARSLPPRVLSDRHDPGLGRGCWRAGGFLATHPAAERSGCSGAPAPSGRARHSRCA
jgi:GH24 family phage-related lysozyme (muramidase)